MKSARPAVGIVGTGNFGQYLAKWLAPHAEVRMAGRSSSAEDYQAALAAQAIILAVPFEAYPAVLDRIKGRLLPQTVVVDVCSTKDLPVRALREALPGQPILALHPLFGPETAAASLTGHMVVLCPQAGMSQLERQAARLMEEAGLEVVEMTAARHDRLMADLQALTFFVARVLANYGVAEQPVMTPSYRQLLKLADLERHHTPELFRTIQQANPHAAVARQRFIDLANQLNGELADGQA